MADAGLRLAVEGEKEFKAALAEIDAAVKTNQKSMKLLTEEIKLNEQGMKDASSGFGSLAEVQERLSVKGKVLADSIEMQTEKVGLLDARVEEARETYGEYDKKTLELKNQLLDATTVLTKLTAEQEKNRQAMLDAQNSTKEYDDAVAVLEAQLKANDAELRAMGGGLEELQKEYGETGKSAGSLGKSTEDLGKRYGETGKSADDLGKSTGDLGKKYGDTGKSADDLARREENLRKQNENLNAQNAKLSDSIGKQRELIDNLAKAQEVSAARYGEGSKQAEEYRKRLADATGQLDKMERELRENEKAIEDNNEAIESGGDAPNAMISGLEKVEQLTGIKIPAGIKDMIGGFDGGTVAVGGIVTALTAVGKKMLDIYNDTLDWANDVTTKSAELDLSTSEYQQLEYVAAKAGVSVNVFEAALSKVSKKAGDAEVAQATLTKQIEEQEEAVRKAWVEWDKIDQLANSGTWSVWEKDWNTAKATYDEAEKALSDLKDQLADATEYWDDLGISLTDTNGAAKSSLDLLLELIDAYAEIPEGIERTAATSEVFGESFRIINPLIQSGSATLRDWMQEWEEINAGMDEASMATNNYAAAMKRVFDKIMDVAKKKAMSDWADSGFSIAGGFKAAADMVNAFNDAVKLISGIEPLKVIFGWSSDKKWYENLFGFGSSNIGMLKNLFGFASGTNYAPGGMALVGERGPEIVELPRGSKVYPNGTAPGIGGATVNESNVYNITIDASSVEEFNDIVRIAQTARVGMRRG